MRYLHRFFSRWQNWLIVILLLGFFITAIAAPIISPENPKDPGAFPHISEGIVKNRPPMPPNEKAPAWYFAERCRCVSSACMGCS